ncbi:MAG: hypothetical protein ACJAXZ_003949 [Akkermansiaceae bacterium]|jgi:hypothetical protein
MKVLKSFSFFARVPQLQRLNPFGGLPQTVVTIFWRILAEWIGGLPER